MSAYAITFGDAEPAPVKDCVHLDAKNFLVSRRIDNSTVSLTPSSAFFKIRPDIPLFIPQC